MENYTKILAGNIASLRRDAGMTQDALAAKLGITFQAVSKWENEISCPDIAMLPVLADIFGVSVDRLLGRESAGTKSSGTADSGTDATGADATGAKGAKSAPELPWDDDDTVRGMIFIGRRLMSKTENLSDFTFRIEGEPQNVSSNCNIECGSVSGGASAEGDINCGAGISGGASAGGDLHCRHGISGGAKAGGDIECGDGISGGVKAGDYVTCGNVSGGVSAGGDITASGKISGAVTCGGDLSCTVIEGDVRCSGDITYK